MGNLGCNYIQLLDMEFIEHHLVECGKHHRSFCKEQDPLACVVEDQIKVLKLTKVPKLGNLDCNCLLLLDMESISLRLVEYGMGH